MADREVIQSRKELSDTLPALKYITNGVSWQRSNIPYLVLDGLPWSKPHWYNSTYFDISMWVSLFLERLTDNSTLLSSSYDIPSNGDNVSFQSNNSGMPKYYHNTAGNFAGTFNGHADFWRKRTPDLDSGFIGSEFFYQDLNGMGASSFSTNSGTPSPGSVNGEPFQSNSIVSKRILPPQSTEKPTSRRDLKILGGNQQIHLPQSIESELAGDNTAPRNPFYPNGFPKSGDKGWITPRKSWSSNLEPNSDHSPQTSPLRSLDFHPRQEIQPVTVKNETTPSIHGDLKALEDAHESGQPIVIIASPEYFFDLIRLPSEYASEYAYNFMGLFFLVDIQVSPLGMQPSRSITDFEVSGKRSGLSFQCYPIRRSP